MLWDIFCKVIDNHGDIGVCWRLAAELARRGDRVRLWADDPAPLTWMAPMGHPGVQVIAWSEPAPEMLPGDVVVEAFGCDPPAGFVQALAAKTRSGRRQPPWINLEYLSAEPYVERSHGLPSPLQHGPGAGLVKSFFYPGFTARTGGLLREADLQARQAAFDPAAWLQGMGIEPAGAQLVSMFCYEPPAMRQLLAQLAQASQPSLLLVTSGRAQAAVAAAMQDMGNHASLRVQQLPLLTQLDFDHLLWCCDLNFVRGEDSLVRAIWAGRPFVWQIYPQDDGAHHAKLEAFLDWLQAPPGLRDFHRVWNASSPDALPPITPAAWASTAQLARARAWQLHELAESLRFAATRAATI